MSNTHVSFVVWLAVFSGCALPSQLLPSPERGPALLTRVRPLTLEGARSGEGYFNRDGSAMVFQSEREPGNPFFQIYWMDLRTGEVERLSPGYGKTTCAWVHPTGDRVLFASTHEDPDARKKQEAELELRASGKERRYRWDYDAHYELYTIFREGVERGALQRLTRAPGYVAEDSFSPDGAIIVFASICHAYISRRRCSSSPSKARCRLPSRRSSISIPVASRSSRAREA